MIKRYNYRENCRCAVRLPEKEMINGQGRGDVSRLRYGICHMSFNGCEVISVYNALQYKGKPQPLPEVAAFMERYRLLMGFFRCFTIIPALMFGFFYKPLQDKYNMV